MQVWAALKQDLRDLWQGYRTITQAFVIYTAMTLSDFVSSMGHWPPGFRESNPFSRHPDGSFYLAHAIVNGVASTFGVAAASASLFMAARVLDKRWAQFVASLPWLYYGWAHLDAALQNWQIKMGLFTPIEDHMFRLLDRLLGR